MLNSTEKKIKSTKINAIVQIALVAVALIVYLIVQFAVGKEALGFAPVCMLFIVYFLGAFLYGVVLGLMTRSGISVVFGGVSGVIGLEFLLFCVANAKYWYVWILIGLVMLIMIFALTFFLKSDKLAIEFDNAKDSGRKTYDERMAEKAAMPKPEEKPLPEIKSFKD